VRLIEIIKPKEKLSSIRQILLLALFLILIILTFFKTESTSAQNIEAEGPYYLVQEGDSLWGISNRFGISLEELQVANEITDPSQLTIGMHILIPGIQGVSGRVDVLQVKYGDSLQSLSYRYQISEKDFVQLNRLTNPDQLIAGSYIVVPIENEQDTLYHRIVLAPGQSILELAVQNDANPWEWIFDQRLWRSWALLPGNLIKTQIPIEHNSVSIINSLPASFNRVEITPFPPVQGKTIVIKVDAPPGIVINGSLNEWELNFFSQEDDYIALQGIHTLTEAGVYTLALSGQLNNGVVFNYSQPILINSTEYIYDPVLIVDPETVDPKVTQPEAELWASLGKTVTQEKMWNGLFVSPVPSELTECWTSFFGNRRSYNGSMYDYFHSGLDFCGRVGTELYAPAAGEVVFTDFLVVRGGVVVIDHGWGVYSAYDHLSEILVKPGDLVQPGQAIGLGGETGRTTGPHLHWEVWVGGVQIDPVDWLEQVYP
jgi:murein DD-endopeptidase MepM/ murein hydrolase activator NlpD